MPGDLSATLLEGVSRAIERRSGLAFPPDKWPDLRKGLAEASDTLGLAGARELAERFLSPSAPSDWTTVLLDHLTIGETYFFREPDMLDGIEKQVIPQLLRERRGGSRKIRVWSAGCSTGEEAYTLAMLLIRSIADIEAWDVSVLATDLNTESLLKAQSGVYTAWSFRGTPAWVKNGFFRPAGEGAWSVVPEVRRLVRFERLNLGTEPYPASWNGTDNIDLVFCRNVLMYFSPERIEHVLSGLLASLVPGGFFVVSANELSLAQFEGFERIEHGKAFYFRKPLSGKPAASRPRSAPPPTGRPPANALRAPRPKAEALRIPVSPVPPLADPLSAARRSADAGRFDEAAIHCRAALEADPMNPAAYYLYGVILQEKGDPTAAAREFRRAIYLDSDFVAPHISLGHLLHGSGHRPEASRYFSNALAILARYPADEILRESGGTTVGGLAAMIRSIAPEASPGRGEGEE
ncbi:MAG TPA: CheR family methyltransferase [Candidatus Deferrimicrobiaceae bacterium]|jgi:chemotaxis protein methyltransferase CheR